MNGSAGWELIFHNFKRERDDGFITGLINPMMGFNVFYSAAATLGEIEVAPPPLPSPKIGANAKKPAEHTMRPAGEDKG